MGGKRGMSKELEEVPGGQKRVSKEEQGGRWGQRKRERPENVGLVKIPHQMDSLSYSY